MILDEYVAPVPGRPMPHPLPEGIPGVISMCEAARKAPHAALVALGGLVGCRVAESLSIRPMDIDLHDMMVTIRGKGDKTRVVPVSRTAWTYLAPVCVERFALQTESLLPYGDRFARQLITDLGVRAKLRRAVSSHDLRATFATHVFDTTNNIRLTQELLGHASVTTTEAYTLVERRAMRSAVEFDD